MVEKTRSIRYGQYIRETQVDHRHISYNDLTAPAVTSSRRISLRPLDVYRLVQPYISLRFLEQLYALVPLALYLAFFQLLILRQEVEGTLAISLGLLAVIVGLMLFMEGIKQGLMPLGEFIGNTLPKKQALPAVLLVAFLLGIGVTFAEPAIGALKAAGALVKVEKAPYLYALLTDYADWLVLLVGVGVGLAAVLGTLRFVYNWSLKPYIYLALTPALLLTLYFMQDPNLAPVLGLAWDSGAVTTGPVTVPLVLALGIGIASASGRGSSALVGFGIVTLASLFPVICVLGLALYVSWILTPEAIIQAASVTTQLEASIAWYQQTPGEEMVLGLRAILPLVLFLLLISRFLLKEKLNNGGILAYGIFLAVAGMILFNIGLTYGLAALGGQAGSLLPSAFTALETPGGQLQPAIYSYGLGLLVVLCFAWILGFGATLAEPALNALGMTVERLTQGVFKKRTLIYAVSLGVGSGILLGVLKIIFDWPLAWLLIPFYLLALLLTYFSSEEFVNIAWDSAGVTTGPITVPLVLAMGLGIGEAVQVAEGFGILSMASIGPILAVLTTGLWAQWQAKHQQETA
ncbi:DUF1538 domain-containing protein [Marinospirillum perlucidum]|uniref:DUF1538 domain-containing protein n=1 Tax=Marinospirillum perlucidum TaxID=1982602 RepID=UPI000DF44DE6|nr:DUF1538 domain-containing protein [Marinospirillum perlucidum]